MNKLESQEILKAIKKVVGDVAVPLHAPEFRGNEWSYVKECLDSTFVSSVGKYVDEFEIEIAKLTGARRAVAVVNGTAALQIALKLAGITERDEVIVPALTFAATANAVSYWGAIPHFVDINEMTLGIDPFDMREWLLHIAEQTGEGLRNRLTGRRIHAMIPVHTFGHPADLENLLAVAHDFKLVLIEDAAESLGSFYRGQHTGTLGQLGALSFNGNKIVTTGGGGAILTNDERLADYAKHITTTAKLPHPWEYRHDQIGYNFRMPNLNAALGCAQLEQLPKFVASKRKLYERYREVLQKYKGVRLMAEPPNCKSNYWLQTLILDSQFSSERDNFLSTANAIGLGTRPAWMPMHQLPHFAGCPRAPLPMVESMAERIINLPSSAVLGGAE